MITLYTFGPAFGLPDPSPFVTKAEVLLKMAGLPYRTDTTGFRKAPKGKLPYIEDGGERIADSTFIRLHLEQKYGVDFDRGLDPERRAIAWAFEKLAEDHLYWAIVESRWSDDANFDKGPRTFFRVVPAPLTPRLSDVIVDKVPPANDMLNVAGAMMSIAQRPVAFESTAVSFTPYLRPGSDTLVVSKASFPGPLLSSEAMAGPRLSK